MEGLALPAGAGVDVELNGKTYLLAPMDLGIFGAVELHLLEKRVNPLDTYAAALDAAKAKDADGLTILDRHPEMASMLLNKAWEDMRKGEEVWNKITREQVGEWIDTMEGLVYTYWLCLKRNQPDITLEFVRDEMAADVKKEGMDVLRRRLIKKRDMVSGVDPVGNSNGPTQTPAEPAAPAEASTSLGENTSSS